MKKNNLILIFICLYFISCTNSDPILPDESAHVIKKESISGFVQKGPFINGTSIIISELDTNLIQTGRTFSTQINNNTGSFEVKGVELVSPYIEIKADGFYYNEIMGEVSSERLTLQAIANLNDQSTVNVNVLTTLEKFRLEYLFGQGKSYAEAKKQAQKEVLALFEIEKHDIDNSEALNIVNVGEDNGILLAISIIIQGDRSVSGISELLSNISFDMMENGSLDVPSNGSLLINGVKNMDLGVIRTNLLERYAELGKTIDVPEYESIIEHFIENTSYEYTLSIQYPKTGKFGNNVLALEDGAIIETHREYSMNAIMPTGCKLRVVFRYNKTDTPGSLIRYAMIGEIAQWNDLTGTNIDRLEWKTKSDFRSVDTKIALDGVGSGVFEIYENDDTNPTSTINIRWDFVDEISSVFPETGAYGENLLVLPDNTVLDKSKTYSIAVDVPDLVFFHYYYNLIRTSQSGTITYSSVDGWENFGYSNDKKSIYFGLFNPNKKADALIKFEGEGAFNLVAFLRQEFIIIDKNFTWK